MTLQRMKDEAERLRARIEEYQQRLKVLGRKIVEAENMEIIALVRNLDIQPDELGALLAQLRAGQSSECAADAAESENIEDAI